MTQSAADIFLATNLELEIGGRPLLQLDELRLTAGEIVVLRARSGGGKTTLLRAIAGLDDPARGEIWLRGKTAEQWGWPTFRRLMPYIAQLPVMVEGTVEENLRRPFGYRSADGVEYDHAAALDLLKAMGLPAGIVSQNARSLSVGEQQRVGLVRGLLLKPAVLLLDEPMSALDDHAAALVQAVLTEAASSGKLAVLAASHQSGRDQGWCDRVVELITAEVNR